MVTVSTYKGDYTFQSADDVIKFVQTAAKEKDSIWVSGDAKYPCLSVCTNEPYAAINFLKVKRGICGSLIMKTTKRRSLFLRRARSGVQAQTQ